jgi:hypothetical protein
MHIFLGGKTCCAFDCTPNVDTAIEDKMKDRQKATGYTCNSHLQKGITILFANKLDNVLVQITLLV